MKCEFTVIIDDGMSCIGTALETNDNVCFLRHHICDFTFSFVTPVGSDYCFNHFKSSLFSERKCESADEQRIFLLVLWSKIQFHEVKFVC